MNARKAVFLDLFGTLVEDHGVADKVPRIRFKQGAIKALKRFEDAGFLAFVGVCHQTFKIPGADYVQQIQGLVLDEVRRHGIDPATIQYVSSDSKATPVTAGTLRGLAHDHHLDLGRCVIVGDLMKDVKLGREVGARTVLLNSSDDSPAFDNTDWIEPDFVVEDLGEAADKLLRRRG